MTVFVPSKYADPANRPFCGLFLDTTDEQVELINATVRHLSISSLQLGRDDNYNLVSRLADIIEYGGFYNHNLLDNPEYANGYIRCFPTDEHKEFGLYESMSAWYDVDTRLFNVLEWSKVSGVTVRTYAPMAFIKKLNKTYSLNRRDEDVTWKSYQKYIQFIFPKRSKMSIEIIDNAASIYDYEMVTSCMQGTDYVKFYETAPVKGILVKIEETVVARALLWTLDDGRRIVGRCYDSCGYAEQMINEWCIENKVLTRNKFDNTMMVTCPVSSHGIAYQDDLVYAVRKDNNIILFADSNTATSWAKKNKAYLKTYFSAREQEGGNYCFSVEFVKCFGGKSYPITDTIEYKGKRYATQELLHLSPYQLHSYPSSKVVAHPIYEHQCITVGELSVSRGQLAPTVEFINVNGELVHPISVWYEANAKGLTGHKNVGKPGGATDLYWLLGNLKILFKDYPDFDNISPEIQDMMCRNVYCTLQDETMVIKKIRKMKKDAYK